MPKVVVQKWEESERGWGTRPDGYSIHLSVEDLAQYIVAYWDSMPKEVPDEYSRPCGKPYHADVSDAVYAQLQHETALTRHGIRMSDNNYPGNGGVDGWKKVVTHG